MVSCGQKNVFLGANPYIEDYSKSIGLVLVCYLDMVVGSVCNKQSKCFITIQELLPGDTMYGDHSTSDKLELL